MEFHDSRVLEVLQNVSLNENFVGLLLSLQKLCINGFESKQVRGFLALVFSELQLTLHVIDFSVAALAKDGENSEIGKLHSPLHFNLGSVFVDVHGLCLFEDRLLLSCLLHFLLILVQLYFVKVRVFFLSHFGRSCVSDTRIYGVNEL